MNNWVRCSWAANVAIRVDRCIPQITANREYVCLYYMYTICAQHRAHGERYWKTDMMYFFFFFFLCSIAIPYPSRMYKHVEQRIIDFAVARWQQHHRVQHNSILHWSVWMNHCGSIILRKVFFLLFARWSQGSFGEECKKSFQCKN